MPAHTLPAPAWTTDPVVPAIGFLRAPRVYRWVRCFYLPVRVLYYLSAGAFCRLRRFSLPRTACCVYRRACRYRAFARAHAFNTASFLRHTPCLPTAAALLPRCRLPAGLFALRAPLPSTHAVVPREPLHAFYLFVTLPPPPLRTYLLPAHAHLPVLHFAVATFAVLAFRILRLLSSPCHTIRYAPHAFLPFFGIHFAVPLLRPVTAVLRTCLGWMNDGWCPCSPPPYTLFSVVVGDAYTHIHHGTTTHLLLPLF